MSDLQKFIRQHFFDNNWTKDIDLTSLSAEKLRCIDSSFSHIDVKSKLCLLLAFSNSKSCEVTYVKQPHKLATTSSNRVHKGSLNSYIKKNNKNIENIFLQALDEENNLVKAIATILHSKQSLNYLNFDISPTNEAFEKNIEKLLKSSNNWNCVETPLLAEYLGQNVLDIFISKNSSSNITNTGSSNSSNYGFNRRGKPESQYLKESYLEKLKEECQRRRVHVPIPGRSSTRQDENEDFNNNETIGFMNNSATSAIGTSQSDGISSKRKSTFPRVGCRNTDDAGLKQSTLWSRTSVIKRNNLNNNPNSSTTASSNNSVESRLLPLSDRIGARTSSLSNSRKTPGIKILEFDELPAYGPKAKQLRKEKERELRQKNKQEREERAREIKAAREACKLARLSERQALMEARRHNINSPPNQNNQELFSESPSNLKSRTQTGLMNYLSAPNYKDFEIKSYLPGLSQGLNESTAQNNMKNETPKPFGLQNRFMSPISCQDNRPMIHHPLLSTSVSGAAFEEDEDDDDDDDDDDGLLQDKDSGAYNIGISKNFLGFNPLSRVSLSTIQPSTIVVSSMKYNPSLSSSLLLPTTLSSQNELSAQPTPTISDSVKEFSQSQLSAISSPASRDNNNSNYNDNKFTNSTSNLLLSPSNPTPVMLTSNNNSSVHSQIRCLNPRSEVTQSNLAGTMKIVNVSTPNSVRIVRLTDNIRSKLNSNILIQPKTVSNTVEMIRNSEPIFSAPNAVTNANIAQQSPPVSLDNTTVRVVTTTSQSAPVNFRPRPSGLESLVRIAPRPPRFARLPQVSTAGENENLTSTISSDLSSNSGSVCFPIQSTVQQLAPTQLGVSSPINLITNTSQTFMFDGRSLILAPNLNSAMVQTQSQQISSSLQQQQQPQLQPQQLVQQNQQRPVFSLIAPKPTAQPSTNSSFVQILPRPTVSTICTRAPTLTVIRTSDPNEFQSQSQQQNFGSCNVIKLNHSETPQIINSYNSTTVNNHNNSNNSVISNGNNNTNHILHAINCGTVGLRLSSNETNPQTSVTSINSNKFPSNTFLVSSEINSVHSQTNATNRANSSITNVSSSSSSVKIQDDLCLTESQLNVVQNLFQGANRVTRPEKAMILSFIAGARDNPRPESGNIARIRLSEYRERVLNQSTGQLIDLAVDTYLNMDYSTGKYEKVKYYRTDSAENLFNLPVQTNM